MRKAKKTKPSKIRVKKKQDGYSVSYSPAPSISNNTSSVVISSVLKDIRKQKYHINGLVFYINKDGQIGNSRVIKVITTEWSVNPNYGKSGMFDVESAGNYFEYILDDPFEGKFPEKRLYKSEFDLIKDLKSANSSIK